jgi:hypothetical protein
LENDGLEEVFIVAKDGDSVFFQPKVLEISGKFFSFGISEISN